MGSGSSSLYIFPSDVVDDGLERVVRSSERLGIGTLALALAYHQARDVVPHSGHKPRIRYRHDSIFVAPDDAIWSGVRLRPSIAPRDELNAVSALIAASPRPQVEAWTVFLHNTSLGEANPDVTTRTCFGDRIWSNLCPSHPDVAVYARALARDISSRGLDIVAEALSAQTFGHGHHHERTFAPLSDGDEALMALCFCAHCVDRAAALGCDPDRLASRARQRLQDAFGGARGMPATREALVEAVGDEVLSLLVAREGAVTELVDSVASAVHAEGRSLSFMDLTGAVLGYDAGAPSGPPAASQTWRLSIDSGAVTASADSYSVLGYVRDPERLAIDVASYRDRIDKTHLRVILRPGFPDADSAEHLADKVAACRAAGADQVDFYNYGMYDESVLARIPSAIQR